MNWQPNLLCQYYTFLMHTLLHHHSNPACPIYIKSDRRFFFKAIFLLGLSANKTEHG